MLVALFTILFLGGGGFAGSIDFDQIEKQLKTEVVDSPERNIALETVKNAKRTDKEHRKRVSNIRKQMRDVLEDPGVDFEKIAALWETYSKEKENWHEKLLDARFALKENVSRNDWPKITTPN